MADVFKAGRHGLLTLITELIIIILFVIFVDYGPQSRPNFPSKLKSNSSHHEEQVQTLPRYYPMFQDVHVMIFMGFGFLMTWLKRYGLSSVSFNLIIAAFVIQWATLCQGFFHMHDGKIWVNIKSLLTSDFAAATVLISFGAVLGTTTPLQLMFMAVIEIVIFSFNEWLGLYIFKAVDIGGSMFVHIFGAYFGLMVSLVLYRDDFEQPKEHSNYCSDVFSLIGTVFLWMFWPSFNAALAVGDDQHRAVINTYFSLAACSLTTFVVSILLSEDHKMKMEHIQNATLAGGVAVGTSADMLLHPYGAMIIGAIAGIISVLGYLYIQPWLYKRLKIHDTCGVHNLHGMPGIIAGIAGAIMAATASEANYGRSLYEQFPARLPSNATELMILGFEPDVLGDGRSSTSQAGYQIAALCVTLVIAIVGGLLTGAILRIPIYGHIPTERLYDDHMYFLVTGESDGEERPALYPVHNSTKDLCYLDTKC